jgi:hypothetical protein
MSTDVDKRDTKGRVSWVATFAHDSTAAEFIRRQNRIYAGHLTFFIRGEETT